MKEASRFSQDKRILWDSMGVPDQMKILHNHVSLKTFSFALLIFAVWFLRWMFNAAKLY